MFYQQIDEYFNKKNIDVSFNTLGSTDRLAKLYIQEVKDILPDPSVVSNAVKFQCYSRYYDFEPRPKYTGFEQFKTQDQQFRLAAAEHLTGLRGTPITDVSLDMPEQGSYLEELKKSFEKFKNPLLYMSGGLDSEFVARAMLEHGVKFTPVIFKWINNKNEVANTFDIIYALDFCEANNLTPLIKEINLDLLWINPEFAELAKDTNIASPQINTYVYMAETMNLEFSDSTHVFGGEVRFYNSDLVDENNNQTAVVLSNKVDPVGYNNIEYVVTVTSTGVEGVLTPGSYTYIQLVYDYRVGDLNGSWGISSPVTPLTKRTVVVSGGPTSGLWYNQTAPVPSLNFEYQISSDGGLTFGAWTKVFEGDTVVLISDSFSFGGPTSSSNSLKTYKIRVRMDNPYSGFQEVESTFKFRLVYNYVPELRTYATPGNYTLGFPVAYTSSAAPQLLVVGGGGGGGGVSNENLHRTGGGGAAGEGRISGPGQYPVASQTVLSIAVGSKGLGSLGNAGLPGNPSSVNGGVNGLILSAGGQGGNGDNPLPSGTLTVFYGGTQKTGSFNADPGSTVTVNYTINNRQGRTVYWAMIGNCIDSDFIGPRTGTIFSDSGQFTVTVRNTTSDGTGLAQPSLWLSAPYTGSRFSYWPHWIYLPYQAPDMQGASSFSSMSEEPTVEPFVGGTAYAEGGSLINYSTGLERYGAEGLYNPSVGAFGGGGAGLMGNGGTGSAVGSPNTEYSQNIVTGGNGGPGYNGPIISGILNFNGCGGGGGGASAITASPPYDETFPGLGSHGGGNGATLTGNGLNATLPGSGGGGAAQIFGSTSNRKGGDGANGIVYVYA